jgi:HK97 family phage major capsid protein
MKWNDLVAGFQAAGYEGREDDLASVKSWLRAEGRSDRTVLAGEQELVLDELFATRSGKPFDATSVAKQAELQAQVDDRVRRALDELAPKPTETKARRPDISGGKVCLVDDPKGGYRAPGEFYLDVVRAGLKGHDHAPSDRLVNWQKATLTTYGSEAVGADGGFAVPTEFRENITRLVNAEDSLFGRADQLPIETASIAIPDDETTPWGAAGPQAYWEGEADAYAQSKPSLKLKEYRLRKLTALIPVTEELLEDATAMGAYINQVAPERIRWAADEAMIRGTGAGQPLGFMNSGSFIEQAKVTSQTGDTVSGVNIIEMYSRMFGPYRQGAIWIYHQDIEPFLFRLSTEGISATGAAATGFGFPLFNPPGSSQNVGPYPTILGRPAIATQHCATLGDLGDIMFISPQQYRFVMKAGGIQAATSMHLWFDQDTTAFKFRMRADGAPKLSTTISPRSGSTTMSAFVGLAART